jgi:predicted amidohydrolase
MPPLRVAALQLDPKIGEVEHNLDRIEQAITDAAADGATLVVAPEAAVTGYAFASADEALPVARRASGLAADRLAAISARTGAAVICGTLAAEGDDIHNAALIHAPDGRRWTYRKTHLPFLGADRFVTPGADPPITVDLGPLRVGVLICYDLRFPEAARVCALDGADVIALPTNWPVGVDFHPDLFAPARAAENHCYVVAADRVGTERDTTFIGRSTIIDYDGRRLADAGRTDEEILVAEIEPEAARSTHVRRRPGEHEWDTIADRRPGLYDRLLEPGVDREHPVTAVHFSGDSE